MLAATLAGCSTQSGSVSPVGGGLAGTRDVPVAIAGDCSRDVTGAIQAWIGSVGDGSVLRFAPNACYRIDGTLRFDGRNNLTLEGNNATFKAGTDGRELPPSQARTRSQFFFAFGSNLLVRDIIVRGANPNAGMGDAAYVPDLEAQHGFVIGGTDGILLEHVQVYDTYGDFVYIGAPTHNALVRDSVFARNGRQGWTVAGGDTITFDHNSIKDTRRATIDMEPASTDSAQRHITFSNNQVGDGRLYFLSLHGAAAPTDDLLILNNTVTMRPMDVHVYGVPGLRSNIRIIGNTSDHGVSQNGGGTLSFDGTTHVEVRGNSFPVQPGRGIDGVAIANSRDVDVTGNSFLEATDPIWMSPGNVNVHQSGNYVGNPLRLVVGSFIAAN
jgi:hypothetical protein